MSQLEVAIPAFKEGEWIPIEYTARGIDISPEIHIAEVDEHAISIAITLDDVSHPLFKNYNHWLIWNLPIVSVIPKGVPKGKTSGSLDGAMQGVAYGKHCYKGPKPPLKMIHFYTFTIYTLDTKLDLPIKSTREDFFKAADGHILQKATYTGKFQSRRK
ncbi:YbhB/YbcL family Raf kinase inhibitor-like protein [Anaerotignum sp. MB30-C6]|uniref:YbhB/YbcL family Raf kinase inhibitor-like protein n=1 Tax=Anaerotignum sp. MB30-C6 TaxID=3070814 RepID=UPI0027DCA2C0|nr:YbhB/YbcL family Raf kinase inhibitor-like protein [Anaerotignum sp. MB30-C6]WMI82133.1 YbhB/YbcL family Raf kinase inhibitor-like protein [Anaerotignum sp. MB30-C6]